MKYSKMKKMLSFLTAITTLSAGMSFTGATPVHAETYKDAYWGLEGTAICDTGSRITVDLNANDGRKASYSRNANNWCYSGSSVNFQGVTFKLSNGGSAGGDVRVVNCKLLQRLDMTTPFMTMDGVTIGDTDSGGVIKLEISGLSAGTHSIKMWHSCVDNVSVGTLSVSVNGKTTATGVKCPTRVTDVNDAGISYSTFEVSAGQTVTVLISPEGSGNAWLNGFEIDGGDPINGISNISPVDQDSHHDREDGLSWTAGKNAQSHDVYIGTSYDDVFNADHNSKEFKGNQTGTTYALDESYSSIPVYYWRVDTIDSSGNVIKGGVHSFQLNRLSFPTAEGYGRYARGGRGGEVVHVTNLNDSGEGSLRWALCDPKWQTEDWKGVPRIIVFDVGGVIALKSMLCIPDNAGNVYIAGQTAPGDGITLINYDFGAMGSNDVVIRDIRVRVGDMNDTATGGMGLSSCNNSIIDHCSISWATDEGFSSRSAANISFQWNIIGESLHDSVHYKSSNRDETEEHAFAASISGDIGSFHHNLLIDCTGRNWSLAGALEQDGTPAGRLDIRNNVVYNWMGRTTDGGAFRVNFVNNYYKKGPVSRTMNIFTIDSSEDPYGENQQAYLSGNKMTEIDGTVLLDPDKDDAWKYADAANCDKSHAMLSEPFCESYVNTESADDAYKSVIAGAGAGGTSVTGRDYIDSRYIKEVSEGTYTYTGSKQGLTGIIDSQNDVGGYPTQSNFEHSTDGVCNEKNDTDRDGMPDTWEVEHGLNPNDPSDGSIVSLSADDYTNVEMFLNELMGDPVEYNGNVTRDPITGTLIKSIDVLDTAYYSSWAIDTSLEVGDKVFGDRTAEKSAFSEVPDKYKGAELVLTPCDSKNSDKQQAELTAAEDITVFVGFDSRISAVPAWVNGFAKETETIKTSNGITFEIYSKDLKADGTITLGSNGQSSGCVNYIVLAAKENIQTPLIPVYGDLNCDGRINIFDLVMFKQHVNGTAIIEGQALANADINGDGVQDIADMILLQNFLAGKIKGFND